MSTSQLSNRGPQARVLDDPVELEVPSVTSRTRRPRGRRRTVLQWLESLASGMVSDVRARSPFYVSDWLDAWNYRVIPATALIFFAK